MVRGDNGWLLIQLSGFEGVQSGQRVGQKGIRPDLCAKVELPYRVEKEHKMFVEMSPK